VRIAIVILNWNGRKLLEKFLPSVIEYSSQISSIYVADNGSTDDSISFLTNYYPAVNIIKNYENNGYAEGYNKALQKVDADLFVLLNSDVEVTENWIAPISKLFEENKDIAACQPKILSYHNKNVFEYAGAAGGFIDKNFFTFCRGRIFNSFEKDNGQYNTTSEVFWASGACLFIRAKLFKDIGGFDKDFFAHMEEIDLCWRLKNIGHKIYYCSDSFVYHLGGGTLAKVNPQKTFLNFRNNLLMILKNYNQTSLIIKLIVRLTYDGIAALKFLLDGNLSHSLAVLKAHASFYKNIPLYLKKRKQTIKSNGDLNSGIYNGNIVTHYFLLKKYNFSDLAKEKFIY
jgi:GT2 family glycosyltransferase